VAGTLTANGVKDGKLVRTTEIQTTGSPAKLGLTVDRPRITSLPSDVAHVTVQVLDAEDRVVPTADDQITFAIQGVGRILGVDNGQPDSHESYQGHNRKAFNGLALVVLQSTAVPGTVTLSASSGPLVPAQIGIEVALNSREHYSL
jgi:beta-galactosidase